MKERADSAGSRKLFRMVVSIIALIAMCSTSRAQWSPLGSIGLPPGNANGVLTYKSGLFWGGGGGVFVSADSCKSWTRSGPFGFYPILGIDFFDRNNGGVCDLNGDVYLTHDNGATWQKSTFAEPVASVRFGTRANTVFAGTEGSPGAIYVSNDGGLTWTRHPIDDWVQDFRNLPDGSTIAFASNITTNIGYLERSTDFGQTWARLAGRTNADSWSFAADSCDANLLYDVNEQNAGANAQQGIIWRSRDGGASWSPTLTLNTYDLAGSLAVGPHSLYAATTTTQSILRSTDQSTTWAPIGGPTSHNDTRQLVVLSDNEIYAVDNTGQVFRTLNGGGNPITFIGHPRQIDLATNIPALQRDTLITSECDSSSFLLSFTYIGLCERAHVDSLTFAGLPISDVHWLITHNAQPGLELDTTRFSIQTLAAGVYPLTVTLHFTHDDRTTGDTSFALTLLVKKSSAILTLDHADSINFGSQSLCTARLRMDSIGVGNQGCEALSIDSVWLESKNLGDFGLTSTGKNLLNNTDAPHRLFLNFKPSIVGVENAKLLLKTSLGIDTFYLKGTGLPDATALTFIADTIRAAKCDSASSVVKLSNTTCLDLTVDSVSSAGVLTIIPGQFPILLPIGSAHDLQVKFIPQASGISSVTLRAHVRAIQAGDTTLFDTLIVVPLAASPGSVLLAVSDSVVQFGNVSLCAGREVREIYLTSVGCDSLHLTGFTIPGSTEFSTIGANPIVLAPGSRDTILVAYQPSAATSNASTLEILSDAPGNASVKLFGTGVADSGHAELSTTSITLAPIRAVCDSGFSSFTFRNGTCSELTLDSVSTLSLPLIVSLVTGQVLPVDSSVTISLRFFPQQAGQFNQNLRLHYHSTNGLEHDTTIAIAASAAPGVRLGLFAASASLSDTVSALVSEPVFLTGAMNAAQSASMGLDSIEVRIALNTDLLTPTMFTPAIAGSSVGRFIVTRSGVTFSVLFPKLVTLADTTELGVLTMKSFVTDTLQTTIGVRDFILYADGPAPCFGLAAIDSAFAIFTLNPRCGDGLTSKSMAHEFSFAIESIRPNPTTGKFTVKLSGVGANRCEYVIEDLLGRRLQAGILGNIATFDLSNAATGFYTIRISTADHQEVRRILITK